MKSPLSSDRDRGEGIGGSSRLREKKENLILRERRKAKTKFHIQNIKKQREIHIITRIKGHQLIYLEREGGGRIVKACFVGH